MNTATIAAIAAAAACTTEPIATLSRSAIREMSAVERYYLVVAFQEACMIRVWGANEKEARTWATQAIQRSRKYWKAISATLNPATNMPAPYRWLLAA